MNNEEELKQEKIQEQDEIKSNKNKPSQKVDGSIKEINLNNSKNQKWLNKTGRESKISSIQVNKDNVNMRSSTGIINHYSII